MAKTTPNKPKKDAKQNDSGPVLVAEAPPEAPELELSPEELEEIEESFTNQEADAAIAATSTDPRRVPPLQTFNFENQAQWWGFLSQFPDPSTCDLYGYRLFPSVMLAAPADWTSRQKPPTHIFKLKGLITPETNEIANYEWLRNTWGSGKYQLRLVDRTVKRTQNRQICTAFVEVNEWNTHMCVLSDWSELLPNEGNKWIIARLLKERTIKRNPEGGFMAYSDTNTQNGTQSGAGGDASVMLDKTLAAAERMARMMTPKEEKKDDSPFAKIDIVKLMEGTQSANDPQKILTAARELAAMMKPPEAPKVDQEGQLKVILEIAKIFKTEPAPAPTPPPDPVAQMKQTAEMAKIMKEAFGPSEDERAIATKMNGWQEFLKDPFTELINGIKPLIAVGAQVLMLKAQQGNQAQQPPPAPRPASAPQPAAVAQPISGQQTQAQPAPDPEQQTAQPEVEVISPDEQLRRMQVTAVLNAFDRAMPSLLDYLNSPPENFDLPKGAAFADWFWGGKWPTGLPLQPLVSGADIQTGMKAIPAEAIVEMIKVNAPRMYEAMAPTPDKEPQLLQFIQEFQAFDPNSEAPEPVKKGAKK